MKATNLLSLLVDITLKMSANQVRSLCYNYYSNPNATSYNREEARTEVKTKQQRKCTNVKMKQKHFHCSQKHITNMPVITVTIQHHSKSMLS